MAKLTRKTAKLFGSSAGPTQIAKFGSLEAGSPAFSSDPSVIQSLSNWVSGWYAAVIGNNSPALQDFNAVDYVFSYQICDIFQDGVPAWDSGTTYYKGSIAQDGNGNLYVSIFDGNINFALTNTQYWLPYINGPYAPTAQTFLSGSGTYVPSFLFNVVTANANAGDTYSNNSQTFTVSQTITGGTILIMTGTGAPLASGTLTRVTGTGDSTITFVRVRQPLYLEIEVVGGGAGGGPSASTSSAATDGTSTSFGAYITAGHGLHGIASAVAGGAGGTNTIGSGVITLLDCPGEDGGGGAQYTTQNYGLGGDGGATPLGGRGAGGFGNGSASPAKANSGSGGGGGGSSGINNADCGGGGGAGAYFKGIINVLPTSVSYSIGPGGNGGTGTENGANGAAGKITVKEFYQ